MSETCTYLHRGPLPTYFTLLKALSLLEGLEPAVAQCMTQYRYCTALGVFPERTGCKARVGPQPAPRWQGFSVPHGVAPLNRVSGPHAPPHLEKGFGVGWPATCMGPYEQIGLSMLSGAPGWEADGTRPGEVCKSLPNPLRVHSPYGSTAHPRTQKTRTATPL